MPLLDAQNERPLILRVVLGSGLMCLLFITNAIMGTGHVPASIYFMIIAASMYSLMPGLSGVPTELQNWVVAPPLGIAVSVVKSCLPDDQISLRGIYLGAMPFGLTMRLVAVLITLRPTLPRPKARRLIIGTF